jgi:hypothetical protein
MATTGDCNDNDATVHPATTPPLYEIVFDGMVETGSNGSRTVTFDTWLPTDGITITGTAKVRKVLNGVSSIIDPQNINLQVSPPEITHYTGKYTNDPNAADTGPDYDPVSVSADGRTVTLTSLDFGGMITFHVTVAFIDTDSRQTVTLSNQLVRLPRDIDGDGIPDGFEAQYCGGHCGCDPNASLSGDGLSILDKYRGFMWGQLVPNANVSYGYCSSTTTRLCNANAPCPATEKCLPYIYQTDALVPDLNPNGTIKISHFRANPNRKDLFVKYDGYSGDYPFAIGTAYANQGIDVYAVDKTTATTFFGGVGRGERKIDVLSITHDLTGTFGGEDPNLYRRSVRDWTFKTLGLSGFGNATTYGSSTTYKRVLDAYFSNRPYKDGSTLPTGYTVSNAPSTWNAPNGKLDLITKVENTSDDGRKGGGQDKNNNGILDGDYPVGPNSTSSAGPPWVYTQDLSPFNINNKYIQVCAGTNIICDANTVCPSGCNNDPNRPLLELPVQSDPDNVNPAFKFSREQVLKHVITHEIGHGVGVNIENADSTCVMYQYSNNWIRDNHFSSGAAALSRIHNCCASD